MIKESVWRVLGIDETKNQELIKEAYRKQLINTNPEDDAQGFMNLRNAYEEAMRLSSENEASEEPETEKNDIDLWIDRVDAVYRDVYKRRNIQLWEELLESPVCKELDTYLEAREKLLSYLMDNYYLPHGVWLLLNHEFNLVRDKEALLQTFPRDFIEYAVRQVENYSLIDFDLFTADKEGGLDDYIRSYYNIRRLVDSGNMPDLIQEFDKIDDTGIYHPYVDAERLRYFISLDNKEEIERLIKKLSSYSEDDYVAYYAAKAYWALEQYDEAAGIWERLYEKFPTHYGAGIGLLEYYIHLEQYKRANEHAINLLKTYIGDEAVHNLLVKANESLIKEYEEECKTDPGNLKAKEELAWCYYQNSYIDKCIALLNEIPDDTKKEPWYLKICGYVYFKKGEFKKALEYFFKWLELIKLSQEDENYRKDFCRCNQLIGISYINEKDYERAVIHLKDAVSLEENMGEKLSTMERLAYAFLKSESNEDCIDVCDDIISQSEGYYPAYLHRQEAYFNMKNGQGVIDDYHKAVEIYAGYAKPYLLAAKVYYFYGQYEDSIAVIKRAKEAEIRSNELDLFYGKNLRLMAQSKEEGEAALKVLLDLYENSYKEIKSSDNNEENNDEFDDIGEILHEIAKAYADTGQFEEGLESIKEAIDLNPQNDYYTTKAYLYMDLELYEHAKEILEKQVELFPEFEYIHVCLARCYDKTDKEDDALRLYKKTLDINPENTEAAEKIGDIYLNLYKRKEDRKYYEMAISYGEKLLELRPDSCYCHVHVGIMYEKGYEFEKALQCCKRASECDPEDMWSHNNAGYVYKLMKRYDDAIREYQKAIKLMEPGQATQPHSNLATCYEILGRYEEALDCYREILKHWPDNQYTHEDMASVLVKMGRYTDAEKIYMEMVKKYKFPKDEGYYNLMEINAEAGNFKKAYGYASNAVLKSESEVTLRRVGRFYFSIGKYSKAKNILAKALKKIKSKKSLQYCLFALNLAEVYFDEGNINKARHFAAEALSAVKHVCGSEEEYVSYKPNSGIRNYRMGIIYMISGNYERAEYYFREAIENLPCSSCDTKVCYEGYYGLGRLYEEMKQFDRAEECYKKAIEMDKALLFKRHLQEVQNKKNNVKDTIFKRIWRYL